ncbi:MAG TPA: thioredoxin [Rhodanobacteraceae bacterium]|nr:thioredoxin [Rhodanobacteraceae bacterium]
MNPTDATNPHVFDATQANFEAEVLKASLEQPVLVDLWAEWCGPCKSLGPVLEKLATDYNGAFRLAKVDCDKEQMLAGMFGVRSIPTVILVKDGQLADAFTGALPEGEVRQFLAKHGIEPLPAADEEPTPAPAIHADESPAEAVSRLRLAVAADPAAGETRLLLAQALLAAGDAAGVRVELDALPTDLADDDRARALRSRLDFADALKDAPTRAELQARLAADANDHAARDLLGVRQLVDGDDEAALETFLELLAKARSWQDGQAKKRLLAAFQCLDDAALVGRYRRRMASLLF